MSRIFSPMEQVIYTRPPVAQYAATFHVAEVVCQKSKLVLIRFDTPRGRMEKWVEPKRIRRMRAQR